MISAGKLPISRLFPDTAAQLEARAAARHHAGGVLDAAVLAYRSVDRMLDMSVGKSYWRW